MWLGQNSRGSVNQSSGRTKIDSYTSPRPLQVPILSTAHYTIQTFFSSVDWINHQTSYDITNFQSTSVAVDITFEDEHAISLSFLSIFLDHKRPIFFFYKSSNKMKDVCIINSSHKCCLRACHKTVSSHQPFLP